MRIFKFGGASVKDANGVKNVVKIIQQESNNDVLVVISAMGKMTNALEKVIFSYLNEKESLKENFTYIKKFHQNIVADLFNDNNKVYNKVSDLFNKLEQFLATNTSVEYNFVYDQIIGFGELLSTTIVSNYLSSQGIENNWLDVRNFIKTDTYHRDAKVDWKATEKAIFEGINTNKLNITQGFLGSNNGITTTLGREGSDYTAGIFAYSLNAENVTIWKDVPGVLNADPRVFNDTTLLNSISYKEAIEMAFYGASVIHPKTIQPLEQKRIPLHVRSFIDLSTKGTTVTKGVAIAPEIPCYIVKKNQILISISAKDFSFMVEDNIRLVFQQLHQYKLKVNLIQNSAISFSVCVEDKYKTFNNFLEELDNSFNVNYYKEVTLYTIRHFTKDAIDFIREKGTAIIRQINTETAQLVIKEKSLS